MKKFQICLLITMLVGTSLFSFSTVIADEILFPPTVEINIDPCSVVYEGDIISCVNTGNPDVMYWSINNISQHYLFHDDDPVIFNPESTPLNDTYVNLTVYVENSAGNDSDTVKIMLKKIFFGDIHWHTVFGDAEYTIDEMYENAISDNYLDFAACSEHGNGKYPSKTNLFPLIREIFYHLTGKNYWQILKDSAIKYYTPGNFTTLLGFEWGASSLFPGGYKLSPNGCEDVGHMCFYYRDVYPDAKKFSPYGTDQKLNFDKIFKAMAEENDKGNLNICFPHHPQGKIYLFGSSLIKNPQLKKYEILNKFQYDCTTNFTFLANGIKNTDARDKILRGIEIYSTWGCAIGPYSNLSVSWPYAPDDPELVVVCANKTDSWAENGMWEWSQDKFKGKKFIMQMGSDTHKIDRPVSGFLDREKIEGIMAAYSVHNTREEIWDAMDNCDIFGSQLLKIRANVRFDDQMALGRWINCTSPLTINISAMSTFNGLDGSGKTMCPLLYNSSELNYPISDIWLVKKDTDKGKPWCKIIDHVQPNENIAFVSFEDPDVQPNDFYYVAIRQKGEELTPGQDEYTAFLGPVFIDNVQ